MPTNTHIQVIRMYIRISYTQTVKQRQHIRYVRHTFGTSALLDTKNKQNK